MPAKTVLFDTKANATHDLGLSPRNFLQYQPQSRFLLVAGFGNLSGHIDVWDRKVMKKVADIRAPNASTCEWSPCGSFIMSQSISIDLYLMTELSRLTTRRISAASRDAVSSSASRQRVQDLVVRRRTPPPGHDRRALPGHLASVPTLGPPDLPRCDPRPSRSLRLGLVPSTPSTCTRRCRSVPTAWCTRHCDADPLPA